VSKQTMKSLASVAALALALGTAGLASAAGAPDAQLKIVRRIPGPDGGWDYASYDPAHHRVYVAHGDRIIAIDAATGEVNPHFADAARAHAVLPINDGRELLTTNSGDRTARIFDAQTGKQLAAIPAGEDADGAAFDPATRRVFVMDGDPGEITVIDPVARKATDTIKLDGKLEFAAADGKGKLFVNVEDKAEVAVVDTRTHKVLAYYRLPDCTRPTGLAVTKEGLVISSCGSGMADVLDGASGKPVASIKIGAGPDAVIYDRARNLAYIPSGGDGTLAVLKINGPGSVTLAGTSPTQRGARTGALDASSQHIFLPTARFTPPPAPGQRPGFVPGSFEVLELGPG
jgi:DNA-binding beta-propeller fold protein YncE